MNGRFHTKINLQDVILSRFDREQVLAFGRPCRPRILVVTDSSLNFRRNDGFGLWRFLQAISVDGGVTTKPILTLAYRGNHTPDTITVTNEAGTISDTYTIQENFNFSTANPAVNLTNYDQIWMFGFSTTNLQPAEVGVISEFMNGGGGIFATGDHGAIGRGMCGSLPRIRRMREWNSIPMGGSAEPISDRVMRIDTVVDPGSNNLYEFIDQSDDIPQRIYPSYKVVAGSSPSGWQASVHPLLMLPGAATTRTDNAGFTNDVDVMPDHPHESVCKEIFNTTMEPSDPFNPASPQVLILGQTYNLNGQNFEEFRPSVTTPAQKVEVEIVAYAVAGGRSVQNGVWKPPVKPRMFGILSAYDGRLAQTYPGKAQRPGRIVCDSTWHHYVNINLDGVDTSRNGLGVWSAGVPDPSIPGNTFTPSPDLQKIFTLYRNTVRWLQPANRVRCPFFWDLVATRFHPYLIEELLEVPRLKTWGDFVGLGEEAARLLNAEYGSEAVREMVTGLLVGDKERDKLGDFLAAGQLQQTQVNLDEFMHGILGGALAKLAMLLPNDDSEKALAVLRNGVDKNIREMNVEIGKVIKLGVEDNAERAKRTASVLREMVQIIG